MTRIVVISDTHNRHDEVKLPEGDILVHCGDATGRGKPNEVERFLDWFDAQPFSYKIFVAGNHDFLFENHAMLAREILSPYAGRVLYLQDSSVMCYGIKFYGSPWQPEFGNWAFNLPRGPELEEKWQDIPTDTDFLITHGPPAKWLDRCPGGEKVGCEDLRARVFSIKPKVHAFGHIHDAYGWDYNATTIFLNASTCNESYAPVNKPIVIDRRKDGQFELPLLEHLDGSIFSLRS